MNDEAAEAAAETPPAKKKAKPSGGGGKMIPILLGLNLVASAAGVALPQLRPAAAAHGAAAAAPDEKKAPAEPPPPEKPGPIVQIPSIIVNLNEVGSGRYLKVSVELQAADKAAAAFIEDNKSVVRDTLLRSLSNLAIADTQGEEAKAKIGAGLTVRLNREIGGDKIRRVLFTEFVVQ